MERLKVFCCCFCDCWKRGSMASAAATNDTADEDELEEEEEDDHFFDYEGQGRNSRIRPSSSSQTALMDSYSNFQVNAQTLREIKILVELTLRSIRDLVDNDQEPPASMIRLHMIADHEEGWVEVVLAMLQVIPIGDPLGPATIALVLDDCPLPSKSTITQLTQRLALKELDLSESQKNPVYFRNVAIVLGCLAEKLAGPRSLVLFDHIIFEYLLSNLNPATHPSVILFSLLALEKFSITTENKTAILHLLKKLPDNPLVQLQNEFLNHSDYEKAQVGFCSQWCLDNLFPIENRRLTFESKNNDDLNAMLNFKDVSEYLKLGPDGLEARSDAFSFESVRCTFEVGNKGAWYYEAKLFSNGIMQIGWATKNSKFFNHDGFGIGDDDNSVAFDGCRQLTWYNAESSREKVSTWAPGDIVGCFLDMDCKQIIFSLNGERLSPHTKIFQNPEISGFFAAASFMSFQQCRFNFGSEPFRFPPEGKKFQSFNVHGTLMSHEKIILPRHIQLQALRQESVPEDACSVCCDKMASHRLEPCGHSQFCDNCADKLRVCPMCRAKIEKKILIEKPTV